MYGTTKCVRIARSIHPGQSIDRGRRYLIRSSPIRLFAKVDAVLTRKSAIEEPTKAGRSPHPKGFAARVLRNRLSPK
jgi:hypothetical protein